MGARGRSGNRWLRTSRAAFLLTRRAAVRRIARALEERRRNGPDNFQFWILALVMGAAAGYAAIGFRLAISEVQTLLYGADDVRLHTQLSGLHPVWVIGIPIVGGLVVVLILWASSALAASSIEVLAYGVQLSSGAMTLGDALPFEA